LSFNPYDNSYSECRSEITLRLIKTFKIAPADYFSSQDSWLMSRISARKKKKERKHRPELLSDSSAHSPLQMMHTPET